MRNIIEYRSPEYRHSGIRIPLVTYQTEIPGDINLFDNGLQAGLGRVKAALEECCAGSNLSADGNVEDVFLPENFSPHEAVLAVGNIRAGTSSGSAIEHYLKNRQTPVIIDIDSVYINYRAGGWLVKIWLIDMNLI